MNERIRELAEKATRKYDRLGSEIPFAQPDLELFAELIVKECGRYLNSPEFIGRRDLDWSMVLDEHFGIK